MYLRIRKLNKENLKVGEHSLMVAETMANGSILTKPVQLEWWDGLEWHQVKVVEEDADNRSPYS